MTRTQSVYRQLCVAEVWSTTCGDPTFTLVDGEPLCKRHRDHTTHTTPEELDMAHLDATPDNTNDEHCETCEADPGAPCIHFTNPPIARDRMHYQRIEAAQRTAARKRREAKGKPHKLEFSFSQGPRSTDPLVSQITITDAAENLLHSYELSEHDFMRALRGGIIRVTDLTEEN